MFFSQLVWFKYFPFPIDVAACCFARIARICDFVAGVGFVNMIELIINRNLGIIGGVVLT